MRIAVIGSGIAGLAAAHQLRQHAEVHLFEAGDYFGGHTHTVDVPVTDVPGYTHCAVDTGFLVFNERTYPEFIALLAELKVPSAASDMSFSVKVPAAWGVGRALEWNGATLNTVFAQRGNVLRPRFWRLLQEIVRFNRVATALAVTMQQDAQAPAWAQDRDKQAMLTQSLSGFLAQHQFSADFQQWYLLPMLGCIWSCPVDQMLHFPLVTMLRFCHNHGLIQVNQRPQWHTVAGGARQYVEKILAGITYKALETRIQQITRDVQGVCLTYSQDAQTQQARFDKVVLATHSDQALQLLAAPTTQEADVLGAIQYQQNRAVVHRDAGVMPQQQRAWAAWNYEGSAMPMAGSVSAAQNRVCLHYWINRLQPLPTRENIFVSLNPVQPIEARHVFAQYDYAHPVFDLKAIAAQAQLPALQGQQHTYYCGAWAGYGFHEDGLKSGRAAAQALLRDAHVLA